MRIKDCMSQKIFLNVFLEIFLESLGESLKQLLILFNIVKILTLYI